MTAAVDSVPLEFTFKGSFVELAGFFHRMKRFVHLSDGRVAVRGRLMTINGFDFKTMDFPRLEAQVFATVYLAPKREGSTAGATPSGPAPSGGPQSAGSPAQPPTQAPAATVTP